MLPTSFRSVAIRYTEFLLCQLWRWHDWICLYSNFWRRQKRQSVDIMTTLNFLCRHMLNLSFQQIPMLPVKTKMAFLTNTQIANTLRLVSNRYQSDTFMSNQILMMSNRRFLLSRLTHWGRATHICVGKLTIIGSDNGLSPGGRQAIIWTNAGI